MTRSLVIGANGFIGSHLVDELVQRGHEVTCFDRFSRQHISYHSTDVFSIVGDFMNQADIAAALVGQDYVFHFVSTTTPATAENDPTLDVRTNITSSIQLFHSCIDAGVRKVFFASTGGAIYGNQPASVFCEDSPAFPVSPYAIGKLTIEGYLRYFGAKYGLQSVVFRISNPYGPRQHANKKQGVIPIFLQQIFQGLPITIFGDGSMVRDYLYVTDAVKMIGAVVDRPGIADVYNIGSGQGTSVNELVTTIRSVTGVEPQVIVKPAPSTYLAQVVLDTSRYHNEFGDHDFIPLHQGIAETWRHIIGDGQ